MSVNAQTPDPAVSSQPVDFAAAEESLTAYVVVPQANTRLEQLHAAYPDAKAKADAAAAELKVITDGIKAAAMEAAPQGTTRIDLKSQAGPPLRLSYSTSWRLDSKRLKKEQTELWVSYAYQSGSWALRPVSGGDDE
jgi:outer membrane usher protein FimD/PapC